MPKVLFTSCVRPVSYLFESAIFIPIRLSCQNHTVYKEGFCASFLTSLLPANNQLSGGFLRRRV